MSAEPSLTPQICLTLGHFLFPILRGKQGDSFCRTSSSSPDLSSLGHFLIPPKHGDNSVEPSSTPQICVPFLVASHYLL